MWYGASTHHARQPARTFESPQWGTGPGPVRRPRSESEDGQRRQYAPSRRAQPADAPITGGYPKRLFDIAAAICAIVLLLPLFLLIVVAIRLSERGPIFFPHQRVGRKGALFYCLKFRTMAVNSEEILQRHLAADSEAAREWAETRKLKNDPRITTLGLGLRKTSLDELPQLINILKGDMSVVGPRPIVTAEIPKYAECIEQYMRARPGLTGPWQVSGRNDVDYARRVALDRQYVENWSFWRDLGIIGRTVCVVLTSRGCY